MATKTADAPTTIETPTIEPAIVSVANPAPLGLCAFALTTFVLSCANAGLYKGDLVVLGLAIFYGGLAQLCAGMWEFKTGNTFGATAFSSYGAFWMAFATILVVKQFPQGDVIGASAIGMFLLAWTIFTGIMFLASFKTSGAVIALFGFLFLTFLALTVGTLGGNQSFGTYGGYLGIITAVIAWYTALAGLLVATKSPFQLPVGPRS